MTSIVAAHVPQPGEAPVVIPAERGQPTLASVVAFHPHRPQPLVGQAARDMLTTHPDKAVTGIKRLLGRQANSQAVRDLSARLGVNIRTGQDGQVYVQIGNQWMRPPELASLLLDQTRRFAESALGGEVRQCVIAVPAYFTEDQKKAVQEAAQLAGMSIRKWVHEPTAVALAYGFNRGVDTRLAIVDMGGVRLDVSVMEISGNVFDIVATGGDPYLGGLNVDRRIVDWILDGIRSRYDCDVSHSPVLLQKVWLAAEQAKRELSGCRAVDLRIPLPADHTHPSGTLRLDVATLESLANDAARRVMSTIATTLETRNIRPTEVDEVLLVGGSTHMPLVRRLIGQFFEQPPRHSLPPEQVVALGAALLADSLRRTPTRTDDVLDTALGIALADGRLMKVIDCDSRLPITRRVMIPTIRDHQTCVELDIFEDAEQDIIEATYLGTIVYQGIESGPAGQSRLIVDFALDAHRNLRVTSPENGREGEIFEIAIRGHSSRKKSAKPEPAFHIAQELPKPNPPP